MGGAARAFKAACVVAVTASTAACAAEMEAATKLASRSFSVAVAPPLLAPPLLLPLLLLPLCVVKSERIACACDAAAPPTRPATPRFIFRHPPPSLAMISKQKKKKPRKNHPPPSLLSPGTMDPDA